MEPDRRFFKNRVLQHFILIVTPAALKSPVVRREIRLARQEGKTVSPVKGPGLNDLGKLPRWLGQLYDLDLAEHRDTLVRVLKLPSQQKRVPLMAPEPPQDLERRREYESLKGMLSWRQWRLDFHYRGLARRRRFWQDYACKEAGP